MVPINSDFCLLSSDFLFMLSIIPTPIGNLRDITLRAIETLKTCDAIICEDTRVTGQLLKLLDLPKKELISFHGYSDKSKLDVIVDRLKKNEHLALVSDAGTPGISDPGYLVISHARKNHIKLEALPGPSAFLVALSSSGLPMDAFTYLGFLPVKKGRQTLMKTFMDAEHTIVFYESPHRILKTLHELHMLLSSQASRSIVIARELTKMHEEVISTTIHDLPDVMKSMTIKGEFVVIIGPR